MTSIETEIQKRIEILSVNKAWTTTRQTALASLEIENAARVGEFRKTLATARQSLADASAQLAQAENEGKDIATAMGHTSARPSVPAVNKSTLSVPNANTSTMSVPASRLKTYL